VHWVSSLFVSMQVVLSDGNPETLANLVHNLSINRVPARHSPCTPLLRVHDKSRSHHTRRLWQPLGQR